jgi:glycerol-3-phosphate dehydrogenase (NAD(P)+)
MAYRKIGVVGAGAWGTALAQTLTRGGRKVTLWCYERELVAAINERHENDLYLPGVGLAPEVEATNDLAAMAACEAILLVSPAQFMRRICGELARHLPLRMPVVICSKGIEQGSGKLLTEVLAETLPETVPAALSGPSFAIDVARDLPAAVTLACADETIRHDLARSLAHRNFRIYESDDLLGVEIGGAVKNVLAIATGIVEGRRLGKSAHAALITRGFAEMMRFALAMGARRETMEGLSGLGDLVLTCSSPTSRNMSLGKALGEGEDLPDILAARNSVSEGMYTALAVMRIAGRKNIDMPICEAVRNILWAGESVDAGDGAGDDGAMMEIYPPLTIDEAIENLLSRPLRAEGE